MKLLHTLTLLLLLLINQANGQSALKKVEKFLQYDEQIRQIWPGFIDQYHHSIYSSDGTAYLALDAQNLTDWQQVKVINGTPIWVKKDKKFTEFSGLFFINYPLDNGIMIDGAFNDDQAIYTLFHESFHAFQETLIRPQSLWQDIDISDYMIAIKRKEFSVLYNLLKNKFSDANELKRNIVLYTSIRKYRESLMKANTFELERAMEWQEGVAAYIEYKIKDIMKSQPFESELNEFGLKATNGMNNTQLDHFMRWSAYYHGAAICFLLEKHYPQWQTQIEQGKTPFELLEKRFSAVELTDEDIKKLLKVNKSSNTQRIQQQTFNQHNKWKNTLEFKNSNPNMTYQPQKLISFNNGVLAEGVQKLQFESDHLTMSGRPKLLFMPFEQNEGFSHYYINVRKLPKKPKTCETVSESEWRCKAGTKFKFSGVKITIKKDINIHIVDGNIRFF